MRAHLTVLAILLVAILSFFMIFIFSGISFVRERTLGTVERFMLTPIRTASVVIGYIGGFGVFALIQSVLLIIFAKFVFHIPFAGQWWLAVLIMLLIAFTAVMLGILVSAVSKNEFQVMQFIPIVIVPQFFFAGLIPVDTLPYHLSYLSKIMPIYYRQYGPPRRISAWRRLFRCITAYLCTLYLYCCSILSKYLCGKKIPGDINLNKVVYNKMGCRQASHLFIIQLSFR